MLDEDAVGNWRRCRRRGVSDMWELGLALEVRREHLGVHPVALRGSSILVFVLVLVSAAVEVRRPLVLVRPAMLRSSVSNPLHEAECWAS